MTSKNKFEDRSLLKSIKASIDEAEVISFDIFDTLVHRRVKEPVDVFDLLGKIIKKNFHSVYLEHKHFLRNFKQLRIKAEAEARNENYQRFRTYEVTLNDIYEYLYRHNNLEKSFLEFLKAQELELEFKLLYTNPYLKEIYSYALSKQKTIIATTDMYLPKVAIEKILLNAGYNNIKEIFCSGELKYNKAQGDIFPYICKILNVAPQKILHIGDNNESDYKMPISKSLKAVLVDYRNQMAATYSYHNKMGYTAADTLISGIVQKIQLENDPETCHRSFYRLGYEVFGPMYIGYFLWLMDNLKRKPVDKILFFARDAHVVRNLYNKYKKLFNIDFKEEYVFISRKSSLLSSFTDLTIDRLWFLFSGRSKKTVKSALENIGIDYRDCLEEIQKIGFSSPDEEIGFSDDRLMGLLIRIPDQIQNAAIKERKHLTTYITELIKDTEKIAIVDIGWTGNMQGGFGRLAQSVNPGLKTDGYYLGTSDGLRRSNLLTNNEYHGYLLNNGEPKDFYSNVLSPGGIELLELAFVAPHGTTLRYTTDSVKTVPILENNQVDEAYQAKAVEIQQGAYKFIDEIMPVLEDIGFENFITTQWAIPFINFVTDPVEQDALLLGEVTHTDAAIATGGRLPLAKKLSHKLNANDLVYQSEHSQAIWKKGFEKINKH